MSTLATNLLGRIAFVNQEPVRHPYGLRRGEVVIVERMRDGHLVLSLRYPDGLLHSFAADLIAVEGPTGDQPELGETGSTVIDAEYEERGPSRVVREHDEETDAIYLAKQLHRHEITREQAVAFHKLSFPTVRPTDIELADLLRQCEPGHVQARLSETHRIESR